MPQVPGWSDDEIERRSNDLAALIRRAWRAIARKIAAALSGHPLESYAAPSAPNQIMPEWQVVLDQQVLGFVEKVFMDAAGRVAEAADMPEDMMIGEDLVELYLNEVRNRLVGLGDDVWEVVREQVSLGISEGEGVTEVAARIRNVAPVSEGRSMTIARTEIHAAQEAGTFSQALYVDPNGTKTWLATNDERTRASHRAAEGQTVRIGESFNVGGSSLRFPGDPLGEAGDVINCRCTTIYEFDDIIDTVSSDEEISDPVLVAAGKKFDAAKHPRGKDGKFIKKGDVADFLTQKSKTIPVLYAAVKDLDQLQWDNLTDAQKKDFTDSAAKLPPGSATKKVVDSVLNSLGANKVSTSPDTSTSISTKKVSPSSSPVDTKIPTGLKGKPGDSAKITTSVVWGKHQPGDVILEMDDGNDRIVWNGKKYEFQSIDDAGKWHMQYAMTKKDFYANHKNDTGWVIPGNVDKSDADSDVSAPSVIAPVPSVSASVPASPKLTTPNVLSLDKDKLKKHVADGLLTAEEYETLTGEKISSTPTSTAPSPAPSVPSLKVFTKSDIDFFLEEAESGSLVPSESLALVMDSSFDLDKFAKLTDNQAATIEQKLNSLSYSAPSLAKPALSKWNDLIKQYIIMKTATPSAPSPATTSTPSITPVPGDPLNVVSVLDKSYDGTYDLADAVAISSNGKYTLYAGDTVNGGNAPGQFTLETLESDGSYSHKVLDDVWGSDVLKNELNKISTDEWIDHSSLTLSELMSIEGKAKAANAAAHLAASKTIAAHSTSSITVGKELDLDTVMSDSSSGKYYNSFLAISADGKHQLIGTYSNGEFAIESLDNTGNYVAGPTIAPVTAEDLLKQLQEKTSSPWIDIESLPWADVVKLKKNAKDSLSATAKVPTPTSTPTPGTPDPSSVKSTMTVASIPSHVKAEFKSSFKAENAGYWSKPEKIWDTIKKIQASHPDAAVPGESKYSPLLILEALDSQLKTKEPNPFQTKMTKWFASAKGQAYVGKGTSLGTPPTSSSASTSTSTSSTIAPLSVDVSVDISHISDDKQQSIYTAFKKQPSTYLTSSASDVFAALKSISQDEGLSLSQTIAIIDEVGAKKVSVANAHLFAKKIKDWLKTPQGAAVASGKPIPKPPTPVYHESVSANGIPSLTESNKYTYNVISAAEATIAFNDSLAASPAGEWSPSQKSSLKAYTGGIYYSINQYLYGGITEISSSNVKHVKYAQQGMRPSVKPMILHRGVGWGGITDAKNHDELLKQVGTSWKGEGFTSTSVGGSAAFSSKPVLVEIEAPPGTPMAWLKPVSHYSSENEMLLAAGLHYQIIAVTKNAYGQSVARVRIVPEPVNTEEAP